MNPLLDTHALIWYALDDPRLSATARTMIKDPGNEFMVSPVSIWEIAIKVSIGKLNLGQSYEDFLDLCLKPQGFLLLPIEQPTRLDLLQCRFVVATRIPSTVS